MKKILFLALFLVVFLFKSNAQIATSFYTSISYSKIAIGYEFSERFWSDFRIYGGLEISDFTVEPVFAYNYVTKPAYDAYFGAGFTINYKTGPIVPIGIRIKPFEQNRNFMVQMELEPSYNFNSEVMVIYCSVGFRYILKDRIQK